MTAAELILQLKCRLPSSQAETGASHQAKAPASRLRIFGQEAALLSAPLHSVLSLFSEPPVAFRLVKPHPDLTEALHLEWTQPVTADLSAAVRQWAQAHGVEAVLQEQAPSLLRPGVLVMDMDSTAIQIECIDEIAKLAGTGEQVAAVTARAMNGELDFAQSLRERVATLRGAPESILQQVLLSVPLMPGLEALVQTLKQHQWHVVIASGGFTYFTEALKQRLGLSATFANMLEIQQDRLTGQVLGDIVDAKYKACVVEQFKQRYQLLQSQTVAIGDGANDLPMLAQASLGVAFHAKPKVQAQAKVAIREGSLLQLLYLMD